MKRRDHRRQMTLQQAKIVREIIVDRYHIVQYDEYMPFVIIFDLRDNKRPVFIGWCDGPDFVTAAHNELEQVLEELLTKLFEE